VSADSSLSEGVQRHLSRRDFVRLSAAAGAVTLGAAGCASSSSSPNQTTTAPKRGGRLVAGLSGGATTDTLNPLQQVSQTENAYASQLFDGLVEYDRQGKLQLALASEISPNADANVWTIRLRSGVTFHNGKALTADDVIYTLQQITDPKASLLANTLLPNLVRSSLRKVDTLTTQVTFASPYSAFNEVLCNFMSIPVVPVGFDAKKPVGTGPFRYKSFTPGTSAEFVRNDSYWQQGLPYLDTLVLNNVADESSQVNGLLSGQYDAVNFLTSASIHEIASGGANTVISNGAGWNPFVMRTDVAPFSDVRVRQAFRLIVDRPQMRELVFGGHGLIGNDLYAQIDPLYNHALPQRHQDIPQAKHLLKQAGHENLTVTLTTSPLAQGVTQSAQVLAQQASAAGVTVKIAQVPVGTLFGPNYLKWHFTQDVWPFNPYLPQILFSDLPNSFYRETHYNNPKYYHLFDQALATTDASLRAEIAHEMQAIYFLDSGYIIPMFSPNIDGYGKKVHGVTESRVGFPLNVYDFKSTWLS
jgi:peptide/nickel transport system substrate-binding protein